MNRTAVKKCLDKKKGIELDQLTKIEQLRDIYLYWINHNCNSSETMEYAEPESCIQFDPKIEFKPVVKVSKKND